MQQPIMTSRRPQPNRHERRHPSESIPPELVLLTKVDLSKILQMSQKQVDHCVRKGLLPKPIRVSVHPRWRRAELMSFLDGVANSDDQKSRDELQAMPPAA